MKNELLDVGNIDKVLRALTGIISEEELEKINIAKLEHVKKFLALANMHLKFARSFDGQGSWRQIISRGYYSCYCASRAIRLFDKGEFKKTSDDHKKISDIPNNFPDYAIWVDFLKKYKGDRNICDYDHLATPKVLELSPNEYLVKSKNFVALVKKYIEDN